VDAIYGVQRGFSLVSAIFLLVVIAALGAFAVTISTTQQQSAALDVLGARAYQAARAGIEWGAYQIIQSGVAGSGFAAACQAGGAIPQPGALPGTMAGFAVAVGCAATSHEEGARTLASGNPVWIYSLTSTATQGVVATPTYVERQISVTIAQ
jgi:MSHA biogenesis protein MshP